MKTQLLLGDCLDKLKDLEADSVDSIVTDPPYGLSFMGKKWDYDVPSQEIWEECIRILKPGGHLLSFGGSRTYHRMAVRIEDAGFEIRDQIMWVYGSGFPKSHNIGHKLEDWEGWGTALKPAHEPIVMARKPLIGTVANNVLEYGVGGINIDGCRVGETGARNNGNTNGTKDSNSIGYYKPTEKVDYGMGRFPANIIFDEEAGKVLDEQSGISKGKEITSSFTGDSGGASRFFYCPKSSKRDRNEGLEYVGQVVKGRDETNIHPTVKPTELMKYLIRLVTPKGGIVLDPFMGSGSTGKGAVLEGMEFIGIEREKEYYEIAEQRINHVNKPSKHTEFFE